MNWIDINAEEKPKVGEVVLVWSIETQCPKMDKFIHIGEDFYEFKKHYRYQISHWMRMEAPAEEGNGN